MTAFAPFAADALAAPLVDGLSLAPKGTSAASARLARAASDCAVAAVAAELRRRGALPQHPAEGARVTSRHQDPPPSGGLETDAELDAALEQVLDDGALYSALGDIAEGEAAEADADFSDHVALREALGDGSSDDVPANAPAEQKLASAVAAQRLDQVWPWNGTTPSQAVAIQIRCMERSREQAAADVARVRQLETLAVRLEEEARSRLTLRHRAEELEKAHKQREADAAARERVAAERLRAREDDAKRRLRGLRAELSEREEAAELLRLTRTRELDEERIQLNLAWGRVRQSEESLAEAQASADRRTEQLHAELTESIHREEAAVRLTRAHDEANKAQMARHADEMQAESRAFVLKAERWQGLDEQLAAAHRNERTLRGDLEAAREEALAAAKEVIDTRGRLDTVATELARLRRELATAQGVAADAKMHAQDGERLLEQAKQGTVLTRLAMRDTEEMAQAKTEAAQAELKRLQGQLLDMRSQANTGNDSRSRPERLLKERLGENWNRERTDLLARLEDLHRARREDAADKALLQKQLQREREDRTAFEEGWWKWLRDMRPGPSSEGGLALLGRAPGVRRPLSGTKARAEAVGSRDEGGGHATEAT